MSDQNHPSCTCGHSFTAHVLTSTARECTVVNVEYDERWMCQCPDYIVDINQLIDLGADDE